MKNVKHTTPVFILNQNLSSETLLEMLREYTEKLEALIYTAMNCDFMHQPSSVIYHYLWVISEMICQIKELQQGIYLSKMGENSLTKNGG